MTPPRPIARKILIFLATAGSGGALYEVTLGTTLPVSLVSVWVEKIPSLFNVLVRKYSGFLLRVAVDDIDATEEVLRNEVDADAASELPVVLSIFFVVPSTVTDIIVTRYILCFKD
jgi:hypothetical protein